MKKPKVVYEFHLVYNEEDIKAFLDDFLSEGERLSNKAFKELCEELKYTDYEAPFTALDAAIREEIKQFVASNKSDILTAAIKDNINSRKV